MTSSALPPRNRLRSEPDALARVPVSTYRLQLTDDVGFDEAAGLVDYLDALGVTDLYSSPFLETASGASHGYDVSDHGRLRESLGGETAFARLAEALKRRDFGLLIDVVPNHMGIAQNRNAAWFDVLTHGASSPSARYFDIDWYPVKRELEHKVLLPILGDHYGVELDAGRFRLALEDGRFTLHYYDTVLPVAPRTYVQLFRHRLEELEQHLGPEHPAIIELKAVHTLYLTIPHRTETDPERIAARHREVEIARRRFVELLHTSPDVRDFIDENVRRFNGSPGDPRGFDLMDGLIADQVYRVAFWRVAGEEINYRRFFDVNELAAIRMEDPSVFADSHRLIFRLIGQGIVTGLRIDHPDGLYAPAEYFGRLQRGCFLETARRGQPEPRDRELLAQFDAAAREAPLGPRPFYIVAEKILSSGERLPDTWAVAGTTGYDFLNLVNGLFVDRTAASALERLYRRLLRERVAFPDVVYQAKRLIMETSMASELNMLGHRLNRISERHRASRDFTLRSLIRALREIIAAFPVYRTYFGESGDVAVDRERLDRAVEMARRRTPTVDPSTYDWIRAVLALDFPSWADEAERQDRTDFVMRVQQITGPVTAKGYEDTALYRYNRLVSLNEVGGDPGRFGTPLAEFHAAMAERREREPASLSATSTHDTKRSEDVRARINVLSEIADAWGRRVARWQRLNRRLRTVVDGAPVPGPNEEYLLYQTLVGAWPIDAGRLRAYLLKALREAKMHTSWINPNQRYDEAIGRFVEAILDPRRSREFLRDFAAFHARVLPFGQLNSLAQTLIKITAPGVPDFYQGTELWELSLVDPDNRRPVDFTLRRDWLAQLARDVDAAPDLTALARNVAEAPDDGRVKLYLIRQALHARRQRRDLFLAGAYQPLTANGALAGHLCAFARTRGAEAAVTIVPRLLAKRAFAGNGPTPFRPLGPDLWKDTRVAIAGAAGTRWRNVFTGRVIEAPADSPSITVAEALADFPVALLESVA